MGILIIPFTAIMYFDVEEFYTLKEEAIMYSEITKQAENIANEKKDRFLWWDATLVKFVVTK